MWPKINSVISLWNTGAVTGNERDSSHGYFRLSDGSRWLGSPVSSRDSLMPNISDSGGHQSGQRILRYHLYGKTTTLPITLLQVWFTCLQNISIEIKDQVLTLRLFAWLYVVTVLQKLPKIELKFMLMILQCNDCNRQWSVISMIW